MASAASHLVGAGEPGWSATPNAGGLFVRATRGAASALTEA